jgi:hypothetical protein
MMVGRGQICVPSKNAMIRQPIHYRFPRTNNSREITMNNLILLANNLVEAKTTSKVATRNTQMVGTIVANLAYYGYVPSKEVFRVLNKMSDVELGNFWTANAAAFKEITGANRNMDKFVVYKNFPKEVLEKSKAEYWYNQILMYWGLPNALFTQEENERPALIENKKLKVLTLAKKNSLDDVFNALVDNHARWSDNQIKYAQHLLTGTKKLIDLDSFGFKENGIALIKDVIVNKASNKYNITTATDVLRLAAALSGGDIALREKTRFKKFSRSERRLLLSVLDKCKNLTEDFGSRAELWKRFLALAHPGDFSFKRVQKAYDSLYNNNIQTFNKIVDGVSYDQDEYFTALKTRPGEFTRRLHSAYSLYGIDAITEFTKVTPKLSTLQLVKLRKYVETINGRAALMFAPKGNWAKVQVVANTKKKFTKKSQEILFKAIDKELRNRMRVAFPNGIKLDAKTKAIKLQTNDQKLAEYGRGTSFDIPENIKFIRSASYWANVTYGNNWFDNGWNFFDNDWQSTGVCSWDTGYFSADGNVGRYSYWNDRNSSQKNVAAVFSGDPTNSKDLKGRACQMVDLYIDKLIKAGVRYAVWNVLCYSKIPFCDADDVLATLQMGENPESGKLYEPSRAQMVFPLKSQSYTSYVAYIDLKERKLVYMDAPLKANVSSASLNGQLLSEKMPQYVEYLNSLPSVHDLVSKAKKGTTPVLFTDEKVKIKGKKAYVFRPTNANNQFEKINITDIL